MPTIQLGYGQSSIAFDYNSRFDVLTAATTGGR
jgi:hypothetical protein